MKEPLQIAIDGPVASGKGEIAARLARDLDLIYIYTGAMYRALALACIESGVSRKDETGVLKVFDRTLIEMAAPDKGEQYPYKIFLNGRDVTERIIRQDTAQGASDVGTIPSVREKMVALQQQLARGKRVVMEGRDIALRVLPNAHLKVFLTATLQERTQRRFRQWQKQGLDKSFDETLADTKMRDAQDMTRAADPLQKVPDSWELDTTGIPPEEVVNRIKTELAGRGLL